MGFASDVDLPALVQLDRLDENRFRNRMNQRNAYRSLFGGQIVAQALSAADRTVEDRTVHSLHGYFLRKGSDDQPVDFEVERVRDGGRFSTRRVTATQGGTILFDMDCSYRSEIEGYEHQRPMEVPFDPENAIDLGALARSGRADIDMYLTRLLGLYPIEVRLPSEEGFFRPGGAPRRHYWLRAPSAAGVDDPAVQRQMFAYLSDFMLAGVPLVPHAVALPGPHMFVASIDHALWFHRPVRCDDWLLFETDSPSARGAVNLARSLVYDRSGQLVASAAQEALQFPTTTPR